MEGKTQGTTDTVLYIECILDCAAPLFYDSVSMIIEGQYPLFNH